jgi:hypothetical protein
MKPHLMDMRTCIHKQVLSRKIRKPSPPPTKGSYPISHISPAYHYNAQSPKRAKAFQSPFKLYASCLRAREAHENKDDNNCSKNNKKEEELFIPNALETDKRFKVACSVAALLLLFREKDFKGKTARGDAFE